MDKRATDKLVRSPGENGGRQDYHRDLHPRTVVARRRKGPSKGWKEKVERDLQVLGVRRWRELVTDREQWKDIVRQAKAHYGL